MKALLLTLTVLFAILAWTTGCLFPADPVDPPEGFDSIPSTDRTGTVRRAVVAGLTRVDPSAYNGWNGDCPGCDVDADFFGMLCKEQGIQTGVYINHYATKDILVAAARAAFKDLKADDLFVFYISGHGGQIKDVSGDEEDAQDETLCLFDGELSDDYLRAMWEEIPQGVRVFFVTDTCNSGSNYKARSFKRALPREYTGALIHFGGCADGEASYGSEQGGEFTTALIDAWNPDLSYQEWFNAALKLMARNQIPIYAEYGSVSGEFRDRKALK